MHHERQSCHIRKRVPALHHQVGAHHQRGGAAPLFLSRAGTRLVFGLMPPASAILSGFLAITSAVGLICGAHFLFPDRRLRRDIHGLRFLQYQQSPHPLRHDYTKGCRSVVGDG